ncbi:MAG: mandelate racemase/muconate lactonizing enzyme family protein, partial [Verrucomicrobia bacterium]|nr:mandelate racemase/muconate lactonizing enzyme family protein [Verrucomicrobiota bacterium]
MTQPSPSSRRDFFALGALATTGFGMVQDALAAENNPAVTVADKTSSIRITNFKMWWINPVVFIRIDTNHGVSGWGEIKAIDPRVGMALMTSLFDLLKDENPTRIEHLWQKLYRAHRDIRGGAFMTHVIAGIDIALWDLAGKLWGVPVYSLLGGPVRDRIRVYHTPKAQKVPPHGIYEHSGTPADIERMVKAIAAAREKVGPDGAVMFDAHCAVPPATLIQLAAALKPYDVLFIEEPAVPGNIEVFKRLKQSINIPLATGERDRTIWGMIPYLQERCIDILQPDCCHTGGISQMRKIAALAEAYMVPLAPHCTASNLGISASIHATAATPLFLIHEFYPTNMGFNPRGIAMMDWSVDKDGYVALPKGVGLGVQMDVKILDEEAKKPQTYKWPGAKLKDGS